MKALLVPLFVALALQGCSSTPLNTAAGDKVQASASLVRFRVPLNRRLLLTFNGLKTPDG